MRTVPKGEISWCVENFLRTPSATDSSRRRERSWDFCFNYFQSHDKPSRDMEVSCLQLGYYLASWGMLRGSSFLFRETNLRHYQKVVEVIEEHNPAMCGIDVDTYRDEQSISSINSAWTDLRGSLLPDGGRSVTLVSKVMMGVWGCIPSYDTFFVRTFEGLSETKVERSAFGGAKNESLDLLGDFFDEHAEEIIELSRQNFTMDFRSGGPTARPITIAKVIDIFGFAYSYGARNR